MEYNIRRKEINGEIKLTLCEGFVFDLLVEHNGNPIPVEAIAKETRTSVGAIRKHIHNINKKISKLNLYIDNRVGYGYYINFEVKIDY